MNDLSFFLSDEDSKTPPIITTKIKDDILQWLIAKTTVGSSYTVNMPALVDALGVDLDSDSIEAVFEHFEEMGLLNNLKQARYGSAWVLKLRVKAHTFIQQGGFVVEDALNEANIQKILLELQSLQKQLKPDQPDQLETINKIASISAAIAAVYTAFTGHN